MGQNPVNDGSCCVKELPDLGVAGAVGVGEGEVVVVLDVLVAHFGQRNHGDGDAVVNEGDAHSKKKRQADRQMVLADMAVETVVLFECFMFEYCGWLKSN